MRSATFAAAAFGLWAVTGGLAAAQAPDTGQNDNGGGLSVTVENDMFVPGDNTDRYYTQGMKVTGLLGPDGDGILARPLVALIRRTGMPDLPPGWTGRVTMGVGQHMYTPEDKTLVVPDPNDRPYAGWLYVSTSAFAYTRDQIAGLELQVGVVGPDAHAGPLQNWWHEVIGAPPINGWASQLNNEFGANLHGEWRHRFSAPIRRNQDGGLDRTWGADAILLTTAALGNVETSAGAGAVVRFGYNLREDFGSPRLRPGAAGTEFFTGGGWAAYVFAGAYGRVVGRDIFLDGNTFSDSPSVDRETWVPEYTAGFAVRTPRFRLTANRYMPPVRFGYTWVERGDEFAGQLAPARFGAFNITVVRNGLRAWGRPGA
jgi:lipid A 3-O-deacylase